MQKGIVLYIRNDKTHHGGPSPTLTDQRWILPEIFNLLVVGILDKSAVWQHSQKEQVIQF